MANILLYPLLNPVRLFSPTPSRFYHSRHLEDFRFSDTILPWEQRVDYEQPWQTSDHVRLQLRADFGPHNLHVLDSYGAVVYTAAFDQYAAYRRDPQQHLYLLDMPLAAIPTGIYTFRLVSGMNNDVVLESSPQFICESHDQTLLLSYRNAQYHLGAFFMDANGTPLFYPSIRVHGTNLFKLPASKDVSYEDQTLNETLISSTPYRLFELTIGDEGGVPPYIIDQVSQALSCSDTTIDGRSYTRSEGVRWEKVGQEGYPMAAWKTEIREANNRMVGVYNSESPVSARIAVVAVGDSKGFDAGGSTYEVIDVI